MPLFLIPFLTWLGSAAVTAIAFFITRKGILSAALLLIIGLVGAAINILVSEVDSLIGSVLPSTSFVAAIVPSNIGICLSAVISTHIACTGFQLTIKFIRWKTTVMTS